MRVLALLLTLLAAAGCKSKKASPAAEPPMPVVNAAAPPAATAPPPAPAAPAAPALVNLKLGAGKRGGTLDMKLIQSALEAHFDAMAHCYDQAPGKAGTVQLAFRIGGDGKVTQSMAQGLNDAAIEKCHAAVVETIQFAAPPDGKDVTAFLPVIARKK